MWTSTCQHKIYDEKKILSKLFNLFNNDLLHDLKLISLQNHIITLLFIIDGTLELLKGTFYINVMSLHLK